MASQWYCRIGGQVSGPLDSAQLKQLARTGRLSTESKVRRGEQGPWLPAGAVKGLLPSGAAESRSHHTSSSSNLVHASPSKRVVPRATALSAALASVSPAAAAPPPPKPAAAKPPQPKTGSSGAAPAFAQQPVAVQPVAVQPVAVQPVAVTASPGLFPAAGAAVASAPAAKPAGGRPGWLIPVVVGGAAAVVLAVGLGVFVLMSLFSTDLDSSEEAVAGTGDAAAAAAEPDAAVRAAAGEDSAPTDVVAVAAASEGEAAVGSGAPAAVDPRLAAIQSISKWKTAGPNKFGGTSKIKVGVDAAWLGADLQRDAASPAAAAAAAATEDAPPPKYAFLRLVVMNPAGEALEYASWNGGVPGDPTSQAVLVDGKNRPAVLVPYQPKLLPGRVRQCTVEPNGQIEDLLVFQLAAGDVERLRLAIPFSSGGAARYYGLEIGPEMLAPPPALAAKGDGAADSEAAAAPGVAVDGGPAVKPAAEGAAAAQVDGAAKQPPADGWPEEGPRPVFQPKNGDQPDDIGDLFRSIEKDAGKK